MTEQQIRQKVVDCAKKYIGAKQGSTLHKKIVDTYNSQKVLPVGYRMTYTASWCACSVTAWSIMAGTYDIIPAECSCSRMIEKAKQMGIWVENDAYVPKIGDFIIYDWEDTGKGDNVGAPNHVGLVYNVGTSTFGVIEGNMGSSHACGTRNMQINGKYIRGFVTPKYAELIKPEFTNCSVTLPVLHKGDIGNYVKVLQVLLNGAGYNCGDIDGSFGPATEAQVKKIKSTGTVDSSVWVTLFKKNQ